MDDLTASANGRGPSSPTFGVSATVATSNSGKPLKLHIPDDQPLDFETYVAMPVEL